MSYDETTEDGIKPEDLKLNYEEWEKREKGDDTKYSLLSPEYKEENTYPMIDPVNSICGIFIQVVFAAVWGALGSGLPFALLQ
jgi:hypothetical protein